MISLDPTLILEAIGWIGAFFFAACGVPQAWQSWKQGHSEGLNPWFIWSWFTGEVCMILYTMGLPFITNTTFESMLPLLMNYLFNFLCLLIIIYYKYMPKEKSL